MAAARSPIGTVIVTGANGGLGSAIAHAIASTPGVAGAYRGIYTVRDVAKADALVAALRPAARHAHAHEALALDLAQLADVRRVAADINQRVAAGELPPIRALVLNAGFQEHTVQTFSPDGFDMSFQVNYLAHWLLTLLLLGSMDRENGRIVVIGSWTHDPHDKRNDAMTPFDSDKWMILFHDTESLAKGTWSSTKEYPDWKGGFRRYGATKLCEVMMIRELQSRLDADPLLHKIAVLGVDPGGMASGIMRRADWFVRVLLRHVILPLIVSLCTWLAPNGTLRTLTKSGGDVMHAALLLDAAPKTATTAAGSGPESLKGLYLNGTEPQVTSEEARDPAKGATLWRDSLVYAQIKDGDTVLANWQ